MSFGYLIRSFRRAPVLWTSVALTVAFGVAALTVTFGVANAALWRAPPFVEAGRLAMLYLQRNPDGESPRRERWSYARYQMLHRLQQTFERVAVYSPISLTVAGDADAELVRGEYVGAGYFPLLRVAPVRGRAFTDADDVPGSPTPVAIVSRALAERHVGNDTAALGRVIRANGIPLAIVGIAPDGFAGLSGRAELWVPATMAPRLTYLDFATTNQNFISVIGRLLPGRSLDAANSELAVLGGAINRAIPSDPRQPLERVTAAAVSLNAARADGSVRRALAVLVSAVALLHLLACVNVVNLLLGRAASRRREAAVRVALGSGAWRLFADIALEAAAMLFVGGALGVLGARVTADALAPPANTWFARNFYGSVAAFDTPRFGGAEFAFGAALGLVTAIGVAVLPALTAFRLDVLAGLKAGSRAVASGALALRRPTLRGALVALEAALAVLLVIGAGLLIDSYQRMSRADLGVNTRNLLTFWVIPSEARVPPAQAPAFVSRMLDEFARVPGVVSATVDGGGPLSGSASSTLYVVDRPVPRPQEAPVVARHYVAPQHFETMGIPLLRGRALRATDAAGAPHVAIISQSAARRFWPDEDPIGKRVWFGSSGSFGSPDSAAEIVGIVGDVAYVPLEMGGTRASFYTPYLQFTYASRMVFVRTSVPPSSMVDALRRAMRRVDPDVALRDVQTMEDLAHGSRARSRFDAVVFSTFGAAALILAASGVFAVLAFAVATRTREFGIRIALGALPVTVVGQVLREGLAFPLLGLVAGIGAALASTRLLRASLYDVSPAEPRVFAATALLVLVVSVAACLVPAWRATRSDPLDAMRAE